MATLSLAALACQILTTPDPAEKCALTRAAADLWQSGRVEGVGTALPPPQPARPARPQVLPPNAMPRRSTGPKGRVALLHALAHIELNAIDLAWDIIARFTAESLPKGFYDDWVHVAVDEVAHFEMLERLLADLGAAYGDFPAHGGLWQAAEKTAHDLRARLAVVPLVHEARGLDTTPATIARLRLRGAEEEATVEALEIIYRDEINHVAAGARWFAYLAEREGLDPASLYRDQVRAYHRGPLKPPFNHPARTAAGFPAAWYEPLVAAPSQEAVSC